MTTCDVCLEPYKGLKNAKITCDFCEFLACAACHTRYLLDTPQDPHCMSCRKGWTRKSMLKNFTKKFVTEDYKHRREELLFERERSLMPATQPWVERARNIEKCKTKSSELKTKAAEVRKKINEVINRGGNVEARIKHHEEIIPLQEKEAIYLVHANNWESRRLIYDNSVPNAKRAFIRACPSNGCKGFLSSAWKCGLCDNWTCPECLEVKGPVKDAPHTCNPDSVETAKLMAQQTKNCPKCAAAIFKIDGCDQMWCTQCQTPFSWRTGQVVVNGTIHNPHYYEYMRAHGGLARAVGDVPCGGLPNFYTVNNIVTQLNVYELRSLMTIHRMWGHIDGVVMYRYNNRNDIQTENRDLRIEYMLGKLSEEGFKKKLQQKEKQRAKNEEIRACLQMYQAVTIDLLQRFVIAKNPDIYSEFVTLRDHTNSVLFDIGQVWGCVVPRINTTFELW